MTNYIKEKEENEKKLREEFEKKLEEELQKVTDETLEESQERERLLKEEFESKLKSELSLIDKEFENELSLIEKENEFKEKKMKLIIQYGEEYGEQIAVNNISIGMSKEMVIASIGDPDAMETTRDGVFTTLSTWVYDKKYVISFENEIVIDIVKIKK